jgi:glycosyltransferase involved in cell wall biosynthesis
MKFSICIPTHRVDARLKNALKSLSLSTYSRPEYEICLYVSGEYDATELKKLGCDHVYVSTETGIGPCAGKNEVLKMANYEWIVLLDSDDFLLPSALRKYQQVIERNPGMVVGYELSAVNFMGAKGQKKAFYPEVVQNYKNFFSQSLEAMKQTAACGRPILIKKSDMLPFNPAIKFAEERQLAVDYWALGKPIHLMASCTYIYNWNETGGTQGLSLHDLPPEKREFFKSFTAAIANQEKVAKIIPDNKFSVPDQRDIAAIKQFLAWENQV